MKHLKCCTIAVAMLFFFHAEAQNTIIKVDNIPFDTVAKLITYKEVVQQKGTKDELYFRALQWIDATYKNAERVTSKRDRENGVLEGWAKFKISYSDNSGQKNDAGNISYKILIECKDGRYRYTFSGFNLDSQSRFPAEKWMNKKDVAYNPSWDKYLQDIDSFMKELTAKLKKAMLPPVVIDDSW